VVSLDRNLSLVDWITEAYTRFLLFLFLLWEPLLSIAAWCKIVITLLYILVQ
jgi:hypothetical protein